MAVMERLHNVASMERSPMFPDMRLLKMMKQMANDENDTGYVFIRYINYVSNAADVASPFAHGKTLLLL